MGSQPNYGVWVSDDHVCDLHSLGEHLSSSLVLAGRSYARLQTVVGVYRLIVMGSETENLLASTGGLNSNQSKAAFYVFHIAPEWLAIAIVLGVNVREHFVLGGRIDATDTAAATVIAIASIAV